VQEAVVAVLRHRDRILIVKRGPLVVLPGYWTPLSGRVEPGETQEDALVREVSEEVGLQVAPRAKVWECPTDDGDFLLHWWTVDLEPPPIETPQLESLQLRSGQLGPQQLVLDPAEVSDARWVTPAEFLQMSPTFAGDREFFEHVLPRL
jgi:8-oxo-dGTP pyrophosphatase MutT (NUDIX family)